MAIKQQDLPKDYIISGVEVLESKTLGEGAYGVVKLGKYYGLLCAVKKLKPSMFPPGMKQLDQMSELILQSFYNECDKLSKIRHPNVVQLLGVYEDKHSRLPVIVMELMHESLSRLLFRTKSLPFYVEINICHDVAQALAYLHSFKRPIVHRDLSSNNIMISKDYRAKVTDLGVAKVAKGSFLNWDNTPAPGTLAYMPPEVRKVPADLSPAMDIFAIGINAIQLQTHKFPKPGPEFASGILGLSKVVSEKERRKEHLDLMDRSHPLRPLALECIKDNPRDRPSALKICEKLEKIKDSGEYQESLQIAEVKGSEAEDFMQRVSGLENTVKQLKLELADKSEDVEKLTKELETERKYNTELLEQRAIKHITVDRMQQTDLVDMRTEQQAASASVEVTSTKKKHIFPKLKRPKKSKTKKGRPSDIAEDIITKSKHGSQSEAVDGQETIQNGGDSDDTSTTEQHNYADISTELAEETEAEVARRNYKVQRLNWYSHKCLPSGLQGSTLRVHQSGENLYLCGGVNEDGSPNTAVYVCPVRNLTRWARLEPNPQQHYSASAIIQDELVLIGGLTSSNGRCTGILSSYDYKARVWVQRFPNLPTPRSSAAAFIYGDYLVVAGGQNEDGDSVNVVEVLHITTQRWETSTRLPEKLAGLSVAVCGDTVYLLGGSNGPNTMRSVYSASITKIISSSHYFALFATTDRSSKVWKQLCDSPFAMMAATSSGNQLLALGGVEVTKAANQLAEWIWIYDPNQDSWTPVQSMPSARKLCCALVLVDNTLIVIGGEPDFNRVDIAEIV